MNTMRILFVGDIVGTPGVEIVKAAVPVLRERERLDCIVVNAENASGGSGITPNVYRQLKAAGVDAFTLGDHIYKKFDIADVLAKPTEPICKPANYPAEAPGRDHVIVVTASGVSVAVISLMGRTYMRPVDCPFAAIDRVLAELSADVKTILVDVHAEATADKYQLGYYLDGRVSAVLGTHTHVPTADERILPKGTAFQCDVGMTGPYESVLGRRSDRVIQTARTFIPTAFDVAIGDVRLAGAIVDIDETTGHATAIRRAMYTLADLKN